MTVKLVKYEYAREPWFITKLEGAIAGYRLYPTYAVVLTPQKYAFQYVLDLRRDDFVIDMYDFSLGQIYIFLFYARKGVESAILTCYHCPEQFYRITCRGAQTCVDMARHAFDSVTDEGRSIRWRFRNYESTATDARQSDYNYDPSIRNLVIPGFKRAPFCGLKATNNCAATTSVTDTMVSYAFSDLNSTVLEAPLTGANRFRLPLPSVSRSREDRVLLLTAESMLQPLQGSPIPSARNQRLGLRFVTADGIQNIGLSTELYLRPFDKWVWIGVISVFIIAGTAIAVAATGFGSTRPLDAFTWTVYWIYGAMLEQPDAPVLQKDKANKTIERFVAQVLLVILLMACVLNNFYRAVLNVNYISGTQYGTVWTRLDQLQNFTLYVAHSSCSWSQNDDGQKMISDSIKAGGMKAFDKACTAECQTAVEEAFCALWNEMIRIVWTNQGNEACQSLLANVMETEADWSEKERLSLLTTCDSKRVKLLFRLQRNLLHFSIDKIDTIITDKLSQAATALITTEEYLPRIWEHFEKVMKTHRRVKFSNNYFSTADTTIPQDEEWFLVGSAMGRRYTRLVTDRVRTMMSSGVLAFWSSLDRAKQEFERLKFFRLEDFAPLTLRHDGIYLLLRLYGYLMVVCILAFGGSLFFWFILRQYRVFKQKMIDAVVLFHLWGFGWI